MFVDLVSSLSYGYSILPQDDLLFSLIGGDDFLCFLPVFLNGDITGKKLLSGIVSLLSKEVLRFFLRSRLIGSFFSCVLPQQAFILWRDCFPPFTQQFIPSYDSSCHVNRRLFPTFNPENNRFLSAHPLLKGFFSSFPGKTRYFYLSAFSLPFKSGMWRSPASPLRFPEDLLLSELPTDTSRFTETTIVSGVNKTSSAPVSPATRPVPL